MTISGHDIAGVYKPRNPKDSAFYNCVETHFEELERFWDDLYASRYGFWRPYIKDVIYRYLDCGDLRCGFARVRCDHCGHEYLLAFSCKRRHFCPSCHQKRVVEYGEWLLTDVLKKVPHRHWVFSIPKRLRIYFMYDRSLLGKLSKCAWKVTRAFLKSAVPREEAVPGASIAIQTYGDFLNYNPHLHAIVTDGCFLPDGSFVGVPGFHAEDLEEAFQYEVLKMLKREGKINDAIIENMLSRRHTGFHVHVGGRIWPEDEAALGNLAKYIVRASFSQQRMVYTPAEKSPDGSAKVVYQSKDGGTERTFDAIDWLASLVVHIPNRYEQLVRYLGFYSNKSRCMRKKAETDDIIPSIAPGELTSKQFRRNWARLIQKIYEVDPLCCPNCLHKMRIIAFIESRTIVEKILIHLDLWDTRNHDPPADNDKHISEFVCDSSDSLIPTYDYWD